MTVHEDHDFGGPRNQCPYCRAGLVAENARLQERVEEAEGALTDTLRDVVEPLKMQRNSAERERDRYKALAKRCGEALKLEDELMTHPRDCSLCFTDGRSWCDEFNRLQDEMVLTRRAAIDALPEEAREKGR